MKSTEETVWGIHAGKTGDAESLFLKASCIAIGWPDMGDLTKLPPDRDGFKAKMKNAYPASKPGAIPTNAGQLFRFALEAKVGDLVVWPSKFDRNVNIGRIVGPYQFEPKGEPAYPNRHAVKWLKRLPRTHFSQGALYEIGAAMSFFSVKAYADEFAAALEGQADKPVAAATDTTVGEVVRDIDETTKDFILKQLAQQLKGHPFADFVAHLLNTMGYNTRVSPEGADGGIDIVAHTDELGFVPPIVKVQVKSGDGNVGDPVVSALYGKVGPDEYGLLVTLGSFTAQAASFARSKSNLRLIGGDELVELIFKHYDRFDSRYKAHIPLRRVYVPEPIDDDN
jgi:restriction system protein